MISTYHSIQSHTTPAVPPPTTFDTYLQRLDQWEYYLLHDSTINADMFRLSETFQTNPQIIAASDRSVSSSIRACGWICSLPHGQILPQTTDPFSVICRHPSLLKHMGSSPIFDFYTALANTLNPPAQANHPLH